MAEDDNKKKGKVQVKKQSNTGQEILKHKIGDSSLEKSRKEWEKFDKKGQGAGTRPKK